MSLEDIEAHVSRMEVLYASGQYAELEESAKSFVSRYPSFGFGWSVLGTSLQLQGKEFLYAVQRAAELLPDDALAQRNHGDAKYSLGQYQEAAASYQRALDIDPLSAETCLNLGNTLKELGQSGNAQANYRKALQLKPDFAEAHCNLGVIHLDEKRLAEAETCLRAAIELNPNFGAAYGALGTTLKALGRPHEAEVALRQAIQLEPKFADAYVNLGSTLRSLGRSNEAADCFQQALAINPALSEAHSNLGAALRELGRSAAAEQCFREALRFNPDLANAHSGLSAALRDLDRPDEALVCCRGAIRLDPYSAEAHNNLGVLLGDLGHFEEAHASYRKAIEIDPNFVEAYSSLLFHLSHMEAVDSETLFAEHKNFATQFETSLIADWPRHTNLPDPNRTLRIGFVSADLRTHPVSSFLEPVLEHLAANPKMSLYAYNNHAHEDDVTLRLKKHMPHWRSIVNLSDEAAVRLILEDGIDILVDVSGHTARHRLLVFARKPAPLQVSCMGYAGTTGLTAMDYYLTDRLFGPPGPYDQQFSERLVRMPACASFLPFGDSPPVNSLPALAKGHLTFGSFNLVRKLNPSVIQLWSDVLHQLPSARMLIGAMHSAGDIDLVANWFADAGIGKDRLSFAPKSNMKDYLWLHHQIDICLDSFPYPAATTSCHALWMGVPTITMAGTTPVSRVGAVLQRHAGLDQFVARDKAEFVVNAVNWSTRLQELSSIRVDLREKFSQSAMGQSGIAPLAFESTLRMMWQRWCAGLPAESFEV